MQHKILIAEDDTDISRLLSRILEAQGYQALQAFSGTEALSLIEREEPDLLLLDLMLPGLSGEELLRKLREERRYSFPVLILSAKSALGDKVALLKSGADDYITKPFNILEVKARIKAIIRRTTPKDKEREKVIERGDMRLDCEGRRVYVAQREINLTAKEFELLELLILNPNKVYSRESLLKLIWGADYPGDVRTVDVHIRRLREKIEGNPSDPKYVLTKWGVGYYFA